MCVTRTASSTRSLVYALIALILVAASCAHGSEPPTGIAPGGSAEAAGAGGGGGDVPDASLAIPNLDSSFLSIDASGFGTFDSGTALIIEPADPVIQLTVVDGVATAISVTPAGGTTPVAFTAKLPGGTVALAAEWSFDKGELGSIDDTTGAFSTPGKLGGVGHVTAKFGASLGTTSVTIAIQSSANGPLPGSNAGQDSDLGGVGGVGGVPLGVPVDPTTQLRLEGPGAAATTAGFSLLYPYDKTVWPRGLLPPLIMWTASKTATSVRLYLKENHFEFEGTYGGAGLQSQLIEEEIWRQATYSNAGEPLHVEVKIDDGAVTYGPVAEDWLIAPGVLQGTVYYNSYNSQVGGSRIGKPPLGAVLSIKPGAHSPQIAAQATSTQCHVCHTVSADGSTIVMQGPSDWSNDSTLNRTQIFSLTSPNAPPVDYPEGAQQNKFDWGGLYPDGSMSMAQTGDGYHSYEGNSDLFMTANGAAATTTGWKEVVDQAVTPAFSPDGRLLAFDLWSGNGGQGITAGHGTTLVVMDFDCGAPMGKVTCSGQKYAFSGLRQLYQADENHPVGWPSFFPDGKSLVFQQTLVKPAPADGSVLYTWRGAHAELWTSSVPAAGGKAQSVGLANLNGKSYLPKINGAHPVDGELNYEPTVNPIASGGYYWVVFTSRRAYGNVLTNDPWQNEEGSGDPAPFTKKLWVAAIDINAPPGTDPSHPAFYLPGQELRAGNMRGFWVVDPCHPDGASCQTGSECCNGYCQALGKGGALVCANKPNVCAQEFEKCTRDSDCCGAALGYLCLNSRCAQPGVK
jgi:hypothetical protein